MIDRKFHQQTGFVTPHWCGIQSKIQSHHHIPTFSGVVSLEEAADLDVNAAPAFSNLDSSSRESMQKKINVLKEELILKYFLEEEHLLKYHDRSFLKLFCVIATSLQGIEVTWVTRALPTNGGHASSCAVFYDNNHPGVFREG